MATVNERLRDSAISHAVDLQQYSGGVVRRLIAILNRASENIGAELAAQLEMLPDSEVSVERLESMLHSVRSINSAAYNQIHRELTEELHQFAAYEANYQRSVMVNTLPQAVISAYPVAAVSADVVYAAAMARPFQGRLLREWASGIEAAAMTKIRDTVRMGYLENQTTSQIVRRIIGTKAKNYTDGIIEADRRSVMMVTRTALSHTAGVARREFYRNNVDIIKAVQWVSVLDSRTSPQCRLRDKLRYTADGFKPIGHSISWGAGPGALHMGCRSTSAPVTKSWRELGIDMDEMPVGTRASMDGQVPGETSYAEWLKKQSAARQDEILGPTRGKLMREGGMAFDQFYTDRGRYMTLDELRTRDAEAFKRAGLQ